MSQADNVLSPSISNHGCLSEVCWPGSISLNSILESGFTTADTLESLIDNIEKYYVAVSDKAATRCIDGRYDPDFDIENLGPQVPGGSIGATLAYRLSAGRHQLLESDFASDAEALVKKLATINLKPGGHRDNHADGKTAVGCGAIDKMNQAVHFLSDSKYVSSIYNLSKALIGDGFKDDYFYQILGEATLLNSQSENYFKNRINSIKELEQKAKNSIATLLGDHQECLVVANYVQGSTLAENYLLKDYEGIQVFNYDIWRSLDLADKLFPNKKDSKDKQLFITARAMTAIATLMCLTDGSQTLLTRK